jgi:hypothetical protein
LVGHKFVEEKEFKDDLTLRVRKSARLCVAIDGYCKMEVKSVNAFGDICKEELSVAPTDDQWYNITKVPSVVQLEPEFAAFKP